MKRSISIVYILESTEFSRGEERQNWSFRFGFSEVVLAGADSGGGGRADADGFS
jgi:hypothetical protein